MSTHRIEGPRSCSINSSQCPVEIIVERMKGFTKVGGAHAKIKSSAIKLETSLSTARTGTGLNVSWQGPRHLVLKSTIDFSSSIFVGRGTYGLDSLKLWHFSEENLSLTIGQFVSIAFDVTIMLDGNHELEHASIYSALMSPARVKRQSDIAERTCDGRADRKACYDRSSSKGSVTIGNDCWIGMGATILSGVTIGDGAVIGAKAVVASDVPPYSIAVGNPARVVRRRFPDDVIAKLLEIRWWDWDAEKIIKYRDIITGDVNGLFSLSSEN